MMSSRLHDNTNTTHTKRSWASQKRLRISFFSILSFLSRPAFFVRRLTKSKLTARNFLISSARKPQSVRDANGKQRTGGGVSEKRALEQRIRDPIRAARAAQDGRGGWQRHGRNPDGENAQPQIQSKAKSWGSHATFQDTHHKSPTSAHIVTILPTTTIRITLSTETS